MYFNKMNKWSNKETRWYYSPEEQALHVMSRHSVKSVYKHKISQKTCILMVSES